MEEIEGGREVFAEFTKFCEESNSANKDRLERMKEDLEIAGGKPFTKADIDARPKGLPEIGFDYIRPYCNRIVNPYRAKPFGIVVSNKIEGESTAEKTQAIIRGIERKSRAIQAYSIALDRMVKCGLGYFGITNAYMSEGSGFDQELSIIPIERPDMVIDDAFSKAVDGGDAMRRAVVNHIPLSVAQELYGEDVKSNNPKDMACFSTSWSPTVDAVAEVTFYKLKKSKSKIYLNESGEVKNEEDLRANDKVKKTAKKSREVTKTECEVYKIVGCKVVSKTVLPCSYIPIIACRGEMIDRNNKIDFVGLVYFAKPILRMMSYYLSEAAVRINKSPRSVIAMDVKSMAPYSQLLASGLPTTVLPYASSDASNPDIKYAPPSLLNVSIDVSDLASMHEKCKADLGFVLGMSDESIMTTTVNSKTATEILSRDETQETTNSQYLSNFSESIKLGGRVIAQLLNTIYDTEREIPIEKNGKLFMQRMSVADLGIDPEQLGIEVDSGPMSATTKKEEMNKILAIAAIADEQDKKKLLPKIAQLSGVEGADKLSELLSGNAADAQGALMAAEQAVTSLEQTVQSLEDARNQDMLYIQQVQGELAAVKSDNSAAIYKANMDYKKAIDLELLKQEGALTEAQMKIQADANNALLESQTRYLESVNSKPDITIVDGAQPSRNAVAGMRNDIFT